MPKRAVGAVASAGFVCLTSLLLVRGATPQQVRTNAYVSTPMTVRVATDQTMTSSALTLIAGLTWNLPSLPAAQAYSFHCAGSYNQGTAGSNQFGLMVTPAVTNWEATGLLQTGGTGFKGGVAQTETTTSATPVITGTPTAGADLNVADRGYDREPGQPVGNGQRYVRGWKRALDDHLSRFVLRDHSVGTTAALRSHLVAL